MVIEAKATILTMDTNSAIAAESVVWGKPNEKLDNTGYRQWIFFWALIFVSIAVACSLWPAKLLVVFLHSTKGSGDVWSGLLFWGCQELYLAYSIYKMAFTSHFRLDSAVANSNGLDVAYSHVPKIAGEYVNEKIIIPWRDICNINGVDGIKGPYKVLITLKNPIITGQTVLTFNCTGKDEAEMVFRKLQSHTAHLLTEPKN